MRIAFFWAITQRVVVIPCRRFGVNYRSHLQASRNLGFWTLADGTDGLSRNVGKELPLVAAQLSRKTQF